LSNFIDNLGLSDSVGDSLTTGFNWLEQEQDPAGYWAGMLESNACMEAEWLMAFHILGHDYPDTAGLVRGILARQRDDGSWESYYDAPDGDINATVESYAALRCTGLAADDPRLQRALEWILSHGGLARTRVFTRYWLAMLGEWPWASNPNLPPEIILLPAYAPVSIYSFACWARATLVPLCVLSARCHVSPLPADRRLDELFPDGRDAMDYRLPRRSSKLSRGDVFRFADKVLHGLQRLNFTPGRERAIATCLDWIVEHQDADGAWGGIQPPWIYSLIALHAEGRDINDPVIAKGLQALEAHWTYTRADSRFIQASESPVWDTLLAVLAMLDGGCTWHDTPAIRRAVDWLLAQQVMSPGDWSLTVPAIEPGGWAFERANEHYPDIDDTAVALIILARLRGNRTDNPERIERAIEAALQWTIGMQSDNGGWGAFDKNNDMAWVAEVPFCDFGEALDPPSADVTAHVVEALGELGRDRSDPVVARALEYLYGEQESTGSWFGRWGVNHIYGTAAVLPALRAVGEDMNAPRIRLALDWMAAAQNDDGGWGETCASYMDPSLIGTGVSTASQTGWAIMALTAATTDDYNEHIARGIEFLVSTQQDGTWDEPYYTGTGFPGYGVGARTDIDREDLNMRLGQGQELQKGFLINYNLYRHYFPLMALGRARAKLGLQETVICCQTGT
jgi:squalene-hopene/tetraprenyl-beta-curcumene cyclase